jgi:alpha-glucosidase
MVDNGVPVEKSSNGQPWWRATTIYQVYPRSFQDSNGDGIGDLAGLLSRLDYIHDLGFETIWISPFFASPQQDFGYDVSDYLAVAPEYGDLEIVDRLIDAIHKRGMRIVFDLVMNHTSSQHPWFVESASSRSNAKHDWYIWRDGRGKHPPNNWRNMLGRSGWHYVASRNQWYFASFLSFQPDLNYRNPLVKETMLDVVRHWLRRGVDGFRLDIFNAIYKDADFRDNPTTWNPLPRDDNPGGGFTVNLRTVNLPETMAFAQELRAVVDEFGEPPRFLLGEVSGDHPVIKRFVGERGDGLNLIFLFDMLPFRFDAKFFRGQLRRYEREYAPPLTPTYVYSNHDFRRSIGRVGGDHEKAKLLAIFQFTARGVAVTYQGEEIGMSDTPIPQQAALDPISHLFDWAPPVVRRFIPQLLNRDECRTPMQWSDAVNAGFCPPGVTPWLPVNAAHRTVNVDAQHRDPRSLLNTYRALLRLRSQLSALRWGGVELLDEGQTPPDVLAFRRRAGESALTVLINFGVKERSFQGSELCGEMLFTTDPRNRAAGSILLQPCSGMIVA